MNKIFTFILILLITSFTPAQWQQTAGPFVGDCTCLASNGINILAATSQSDNMSGNPIGGLFLSSDNGSSWTPVTGLSNYPAAAILMNNTCIIIAQADSLYTSTDNGNNWTNSGLGVYAKSIAAIGNNLFAASSDSIYRSNNNGKNWYNVKSGFLNINSLVASGSNLFAGTSDKGVHLSTDFGASWNPVDSGLTNLKITALAAIPLDSNKIILLAGTISNFSVFEIFASTNNGSTWTNCHSAIGSTIKVFTSLPGGKGGTNIFLAADDGSNNGGVFLSTDYGFTWNKVNSGLTEKNLYSLISNGTTLIAGTVGSGVFRSTNSGAGWEQKNNGFITTSYIPAIAVKGNNIYASNGRNLYLSNDNGANWNVNRLDPYSYPDVACVAANDSSIFVGCYNVGPFRSTNNGSSWDWVNNGAQPSVYSIAINDTTIFAGTDRGVCISTNNGNSWTLSNNGLTFASNNDKVFGFAFNGTNTYVLTDSGVSVSTNNGTNWTAINSGLPPAVYSTRAYCLAACGNVLFAGASDNSIYESTDNGTSWNYCAFGSYTKYFSFLIPIGNNVLTWITGESSFNPGQLYISTNLGKTWSTFRNGLPNTSTKYDITCLAVNGSNIYAGTTAAGVWIRPLSDLTSIQDSPSPRPDAFALSQNYPNPFNPSTTINYSLPHSGNVKLTVYNILGSKVATIVDEYKPAGNYSVKFNASNLASGIYIYRLESGSYISAKKLILLK